MKRIHGDKVEIDEGAVGRFFETRAAKYDDTNPAVSMLYQDSNPELAEQRDRNEKNVILPLLRLEETSRVLDVGCGVGRWADALAGRVARYHGTDLMESLVCLARERHAGRADITFQAMKAQDLTASALECPPPFDLAIVAGVLHYINDRDCEAILRAVANCCAGSKARLFIRGPVAADTRLTLQQVWSEELQHEYSAIYRTVAELEELFASALGEAWSPVSAGALLPQQLGNRKETFQYYHILESRFV